MYDKKYFFMSKSVKLNYFFVNTCKYKIKIHILNHQNPLQTETK